MQIKKTWLIPAAAAALIVTGGTALACNGGFGGGQHGSPTACTKVPSAAIAPACARPTG